MTEQRHFVLGVCRYTRVTLKAGVTVDVNCTPPGNRTVYQEVAINVEGRAVELKVCLPVRSYHPVVFARLSSWWSPRPVSRGRRPYRSQPSAVCSGV